MIPGWPELPMTMLHGGALASIRLVALFITLPVLRERVIPLQVKVLLGAAIAVVLVPVIPLPASMPANALGFVVQVLGEVALGVTLGMAIQLLLEGLRIAGEMLEIQVGLSFNLGDTADPLGPTLVAQLYYLVASWLFLITGAYRHALAGLAESFQVAPVGTLLLNPMIGAPDSPYATINMMDLAANMFWVAAKLASPIIVTMLITTFVFGLMARTMPQFNIFIVSYPIRIVLGFVLLMVGLPLVAKITLGLLSDIPGVTAAVVRHFVTP